MEHWGFLTAFFDVLDLPLLVMVNGDRLAVIGRKFNLFRRFLLKNLHMSENCCNFASKIAKDNKKLTNMATMTLSYNPRNNMAQRTIEYILSLGVFKMIEEPYLCDPETGKRLNKQTMETIRKARHGEDVYHLKGGVNELRQIAEAL